MPPNPSLERPFLFKAVAIAAAAGAVVVGSYFLKGGASTPDTRPEIPAALAPNLDTDQPVPTTILETTTTVASVEQATPTTEAPAITVNPAETATLAPALTVERYKPLASEPIPEYAQKNMETETVYLPYCACSGRLIRNAAGQPVGAVTVAHGIDRRSGSDGKQYAFINNGAEALVGNDVNNRTSVGKISSFELPAMDSPDDTAFVVFEGFTKKDVLGNYQTMSLEQAAQLRTGDRAYLSGWPLEHYQSRQSFGLTVLGIQDIPVNEKGQTIKVLATVMPRLPDQAACTEGTSGGGGFMLEQAQKPDGTPIFIVRPIGPMVRYDDLQPNSTRNAEQTAQFKAQLQDQYGLNLDNALICYLAINTGAQTETVQAVTNPADIPGNP